MIFFLCLEISRECIWNLSLCGNLLKNIRRFSIFFTLGPTGDNSDT